MHCIAMQCNDFSAVQESSKNPPSMLGMQVDRLQRIDKQICTSGNTPHQRLDDVALGRVCRI